MAESAGVKAHPAEKLGYLGLGLMGAPMTRRLLAAGYEVAIWNRSAAKAAALLEAGAQRAASPRDVLTGVSIVFMCLTDAAAVEDVIFGPEGLAAGGGAGKLVVDFSSIHPDAARDIAARLKTANGMSWIDAPVSGGTKHSRSWRAETPPMSKGCGRTSWQWHAGSRIWARSAPARPPSSATR